MKPLVPLLQSVLEMSNKEGEWCSRVCVCVSFAARGLRVQDRGLGDLHQPLFSRSVMCQSCSLRDCVFVARPRVRCEIIVLPSETGAMRDSTRLCIHLFGVREICWEVRSPGATHMSITPIVTFLLDWTGQISALFPTPHVRVPKQRRIFDVTVTGEVKHGLRLEARYLRLRQEVFAATTYTKKEMQYIIDVHLGKYKCVKLNRATPCCLFLF